MARKRPEVTAAFIEKISAEMPTADAGPEAQLDYLLPLYRSFQSEAVSCEAKMAFLEEVVVDAIQQIERRGDEPEYVTASRRTMGMLVYSPKTIGSEAGHHKAMRIRYAVAKHTGRSYPEVKHFVEVRHTVTYKVNWKLIAASGPSLIAIVRQITGMKPKPALVVGKTSKRAMLGLNRNER